MSFAHQLSSSPLILTECAISERLRRRSDIALHPILFNTPLIYHQQHRADLEAIYFSYRVVAGDAGLPILLCAPTWRIDKQRVQETGAPQSINRDAVAFMKDLEKQWTSRESPMYTGGLLAPKNDCYAPGQALSRSEASDFHGWQIEELVEAGAAVIIAQTMPAVTEASGVAQRLSGSGTPYIISFVIDRSGKVLDGTPLAEAMDRIDQTVDSPPSGYMVNCVYPTFLDGQSPESLHRLIGIQANASSKDHQQLDGSDTLQQDPLADWGSNMLKLHREFGVKILGGCCGTDDKYLRYLVESLQLIKHSG